MAASTDDTVATSIIAALQKLQDNGHGLNVGFGNAERDSAWNERAQTQIYAVAYTCENSATGLLHFAVHMSSPCFSATGLLPQVHCNTDFTKNHVSQRRLSC
jgi:hypothetical protein